MNCLYGYALTIKEGKKPKYFKLYDLNVYLFDFIRSLILECNNSVKYTMVMTIDLIQFLEKGLD